MKGILIIGGNGFIGGHVVEEALKRELKVIIFDRHDTRIYDCDYFLGDVRDLEAVQEAINKVDYVINLAGILGTQETINNPIPSIQTNIIGCVNFLEACRPTKFHQVRGVQIGVGNYWMNNSYSITKSAAIRFCDMYNQEHGTRIAMVRALNAYGERQKHKPIRKIIPTFMVKALNNQDIEVYGDGEQIMDMIYVRDVARILLDACTKETVDYTIVYEAGVGRKLTVNHIAQMVIDAAESKSQIIHVPMRPGEPERSVVLANPETLKSLGDYDFVPFEKGVEKTAEWYKSNYNWKE